jgi:Bacteriodetes cell division protein (FtsL-like)
MAKNWTSALNLGHHSTELVVKNFVYILFLGFLSIIYIVNAHYAERRVRQIQKTQKEIKELRWQYMSVKAELMRKSTQGQIEDAVAANGLRSEGTAVKVIEISK